MSDVNSIAVDDVKTERGLNISLIGMLIATIIVALSLVVVAYYLYHISPQRKFDLARPGDPNKNAVVDVEDIQADTKSPVSTVDAKNKLDSLSRELKALSGFGNFDPNDINDQNVGLQQSDQPTL